MADWIRPSQISPDHLQSNSTVHTSPFSAIAELIDNAYDPDVKASQLQIDKKTINDMDCLTFVDNGNGMTEEKLYKMLSFGYSAKCADGTHKPIGQYGNGFKSGSMRLGKDAIVFTRSSETTSVGFLSQSYLKAIGAQTVLVPVVTWSLPKMIRSRDEKSNHNLSALLQHSLFQTEDELVNKLKSLEPMKTGTMIIIYNLKREKSGVFELDFVSEVYDIRNPETHANDPANRQMQAVPMEYKRSLREYCSILYLKPRMKIVLRGKKVASKLVSKSLSQTEIDSYRPTWLARVVKLTFGFTDNKEPEGYGLMMYHRNRLIKAYEKIGCQRQHSNKFGVGVVGVVEADFLEPVHNKQDFVDTEKYRALISNAASKLKEYYCAKTQTVDPEEEHFQQALQRKWTWAQCDNCLNWRRLPTGCDENLPEKWFCRMNPDPAYNRCDIPEEPEDENTAVRPTYRKTNKNKQKKSPKRTPTEEVTSSQDKTDLIASTSSMTSNLLQLVSKMMDSPRATTSTAALNSATNAPATKRKSTEELYAGGKLVKMDPECRRTPTQNKVENPASTSVSEFPPLEQHQMLTRELDETKTTLRKLQKCFDDTKGMLNDKEKSLNESEKKLNETKRNLIETKMTLHQKEKSLRETEKSFTETKSSLVQKSKSLYDTETILNDTKIILHQKEAALRETEKRLNESNMKDLDETKNQTEKRFRETELRLDNTQMQLNQKEKFLSETETRLNRKEKSLCESEKSLNETKLSLSQKATTLRENEKTLNETIMTVNNKRKILRETEKRLNETKVALDQKQTCLRETEKSLNDRKVTLDKKELSLNETEKRIHEAMVTLKQKERRLCESERKLTETMETLNLREMSIRQTEEAVNCSTNALNQKAKNIDEAQKLLHVTKNTLDQKEIALRETEKKLNHTKMALNQKEKSFCAIEKTLNETKMVLNQKEKVLGETEKKLSDTKVSLNEKEKNIRKIEKSLNETTLCLKQKETSLGDANTELRSLQGNILTLLRILMPNFDYGDPENIEKIIQDLIRAQSL